MLRRLRIDCSLIPQTVFSKTDQWKDSDWYIHIAHRSIATAGQINRNVRNNIKSSWFFGYGSFLKSNRCGWKPKISGNQGRRDWSMSMHWSTAGIHSRNGPPKGLKIRLASWTANKVNRSDEPLLENISMKMNNNARSNVSRDSSSIHPRFSWLRGNNGHLIYSLYHKSATMIMPLDRRILSEDCSGRVIWAKSRRFQVDTHIVPEQESWSEELGSFISVFYYAVDLRRTEDMPYISLIFFTSWQSWTKKICSLKLFRQSNLQYSVVRNRGVLSNVMKIGELSSYFMNLRTTSKVKCDCGPLDWWRCMKRARR
jgi:hypothetical protein